MSDTHTIPKLTPAQRRYLTGFGGRAARLPPSGSGCVPLHNGLIRMKLCEYRDFMFVMTDIGRAALERGASA